MGGQFTKAEIENTAFSQYGEMPGKNPNPKEYSFANG